MSDIKELSAEDILAVEDSAIVPLDVPEWGGRVYIRTLTGEERDAFEISTTRINGKNREQNLQNVRAKLSAMAMCNDRGVRLFTDSQVAALGRKSSKALNRVFDKAVEVNAMNPEDVDRLTEDFSETPAEPSPSA